MKTNCLFFALALYYRRLHKNKRGYVVSRKSFYGWFPHFMYSRRRRDGTCQVVGYVPSDPKIKRLPPPMFRGHVQWGDLSRVEISSMDLLNTKKR